MNFKVTVIVPKYCMHSVAADNAAICNFYDVVMRGEKCVLLMDPLGSAALPVHGRGVALGDPLFPWPD